MSSTEPPQPEYVGSASESGPGGGDAAGKPGSARGRRTALVVAGSVAVAAAVGAGAFGVTQFMSGGSSPATAVPASAIAYASLDLDPSAAQKIEAIKIMRKFPGLRSQLKIGSRDDLRRVLFEQIQRDGSCGSLNYDRDVKPWLGDRVAVAAVPEGSRIEPLAVVQVRDQDKARAGVRTLDRCGSDGGDSTGVAFSGDYMLVAETASEARRMARSVKSSTLADDADYKTWMDRVGDPGIVSMYAARSAASHLLDAAGTTGGATGRKQLTQALKGFEGASAVVRFKDGAVETELSSKGLGAGAAAATSSGPDIRTLPGSTAAALSVSLRSGWLDSLGVSDDPALQQLMRQGEQATGLRLPGDIETLLGSGFDVSIDSGADFRQLSSSPDPTTIPVGIRIKGDPAKIKAVLAKLTAAAGPQADLIKVRSSGDLVAVGTDPAYVASLLAKGDLGDGAAFKRVVPEAGRSTGTFFVDFDAGGGWLERLISSFGGGQQEVLANVKPLDALGVSGWQDGEGVQHALLRLTTD